MTEQTQTEQTEPVETVVEAAGVAQEKPAETPAPEVASNPAAAQDPVSDAPEAAEAEFAEEPAQPVNHNALRGVPAGPAPHPRTV